MLIIEITKSIFVAVSQSTPLPPTGTFSCNLTIGFSFDLYIRDWNEYRVCLEILQRL